MTREEIEARLRAKEQQHGLMPGELLSLWTQESGRSLDPTLKGPALSRGRGNAIGGFQVVPAFHPSFPATGTIQEQADFAADLYAKGGTTPAERAARFYGTGQAPKGHPTTAQYVQQLESRIPNLAAVAAPTPPPVQAIPQEAPQMDFNEMDELERRRRMAPVRYADYQPQEQPQAEPGMWEKAMTNPLTQMGAAIMSASGTDWGRPLGMGVMAANNAIMNRRAAENELMELQQRRADQRYKAARQGRQDQIEDMGYEQLQNLANEYERNGDRESAMRVRAGITSGMGPETFTATKTFVGPDGKPVTVMTGSRGTVKPVNGLGLPIAYDPETGRALSYSKGEGTEAGQTGVKNLTGLYETANAASTSLKAVEDFRTLLDKGIYTGRGDELTREVAGWYSWATGKELPKLAATEQSRLLVQDIVLPALANMKGASSDRDVAMLKEYAQGTNMTETALRGSIDRVQQKYGSEIDRYNRALGEYTDGGKRSITGFNPIDKPKGYIARPEQNREGSKGALTPAEQAELADLRKRLGR